jgi:predicted acylesterase/phospholipase RssA
MLNRSVDADLLAAVAREHAAGRRLLIGTTDFDSQRLVIWDMGAIASSSDPAALELFRKIMLASASIPGIFPPVYFDVEAGGKRFAEMHVDGGAISQVFLWGANVDLLSTGRQMGIDQPLAPVRLFVLRNGVLRPDWKPIDPSLTAIVSRSFDTLIKAQGIGDLFRLYSMAKREDIAFNIACIPNDFNVPLREPFDRQYMNALFDLGFKLARDGYPWTQDPFELGAAPADTK